MPRKKKNVQTSIVDDCLNESPPTKPEPIKQETNFPPTNSVMDDQSKPPPRFSEKEIQEVADFVNYVFKKAQWPQMSTQEAFDIKTKFQLIMAFVAKCEGFILEPPVLMGKK